MQLSRRAVVLLAAGLLVPALPSVAATRLVVVTPVVETGELTVGATVAAVTDELLLAVTWTRGAPQVAVRWRTAAGWTPWEVAEVDSETGERAAGTEPLWRPRGATAAEVRVAGTAAGLRLVRVRDGLPTSRLDWSGATGPAPAAADGRSLLGAVRSRADWGADESLRRGSPSYAPAVEAVVVHHTAGGNDYAAADVPRRIRADYGYHVQARGWSDLGYNLVVDRFGGIWEGRAGGLGRATIGAHAAGFNTGTLGVSLLGDMTTATPTPEAVQAFGRVAAYAAATWRFDPAGTVVLTSRGSPRYSSGTPVRLGRVHGHRDTGRTACPGALHDRLGDVRATAAALLGPAPRIAEVTVTGAPVRRPTPLVVQAQLTRSAPWSAALRDEAGEIVARTAGEGTTALLEWNGLRPPPGVGVDVAPGVVPALPGSYEWAVRVDDGVSPPDRRTGLVEVEVLPVG